MAKKEDILIADENLAPLLESKPDVVARKPGLFQVKAGPLRHNGKTYGDGEPVELTADQATQLLTVGVVAPV